MKKIRMKGKSVEEAVAGGLKVVGLDKEKAEIKVVSEGKAGVLGMFGGEEAEVEIREKLGKEEDAVEVLQEILNLMGLMAVSEAAGPVSREGEDIMLNIKGEELGRVIGKDGATLKSIQILVSSIVSRDFGEKVRVFVDAGGYREKHDASLIRLAKEAAKDVEQTGQEKRLPPMSAADRRVVHVALKGSDKITTYSEGEGAERRLIIAPK
ncbi:KH domain-containing protein [Candidatus Saganbacteria bacterium]|nr:KH domain-containing protein [Candidatus Saganbacteria bacterium]